jgi:hypothetical protein
MNDTLGQLLMVLQILDEEIGEREGVQGGASAAMAAQLQAGWG